MIINNYQINSEATKISRRFLEDGSKVRVSKKTGQLIPKPDFQLTRRPRQTGITAYITEQQLQAVL